MPTRCQIWATRYRHIVKQVAALMGLTIRREGKRLRHSPRTFTSTDRHCDTRHKGNIPGTLENMIPCGMQDLPRVAGWCQGELPGGRAVAMLKVAEGSTWAEGKWTTSRAKWKALNTGRNPSPTALQDCLTSGLPHLLASHAACPGSVSSSAGWE